MRELHVIQYRRCVVCESCVRDIFACLLVSVREARTCHVTDRVTGASLDSMRCVQMRELLVVCLCFVDP